MGRNRHILASKKGVKFESKRADWCTYREFKTMYNEIYEQMVEKGIAIKLLQKRFLSKGGEVVENEEEAFGLPTEYELIRPDRLIFVDEVGSNTLQTKDGNVGGRSSCVARVLVRNKGVPVKTRISRC